MIAAVVLMILAAITIPTASTAIANVKLRGAASDFTGLLQQARLAAIRTNTINAGTQENQYTVLFNVSSGNGAYIDLNGDGAYTTGEPMIQFGGNVAQVAAPAGASGLPTNLDAAGGQLGWTATAGNVSYNARGLPCSSSSTPCATNVNYIFYFEDTRALGGHGWAATSVTAAGRTKVWLWNGSAWSN